MQSGRVHPMYGVGDSGQVSDGHDVVLAGVGGGDIDDDDDDDDDITVVVALTVVTVADDDCGRQEKPAAPGTVHSLHRVPALMAIVSMPPNASVDAPAMFTMRQSMLDVSILMNAALVPSSSG